MRVLLVEDRPDTIEKIRGVLAARESLVEIIHAGSREDAEALLAEGDFDLVVCDLKIPATMDQVLNPDVRHGVAVYDYVRSELPGIPIIAFTAYGTDDFTQRLIREGVQEDCFGSGPHPMAEWLKKDQLDVCVDRIANIEESLGRLDTEIEVAEAAGAQLPLGDEKRRALRIFARRSDGTVVTTKVLTGGLSPAMAMEVEIRNAAGQIAKRAVAKLGTQAEIELEVDNYDQHVNGVLPIGTFAQSAGTVRAGARKTMALFYGLAQEFRSLFDVLGVSDDHGRQAAIALKDLTSVWQEGSPVSQRTIVDVRRLLTDDAHFAELRARFVELEEFDESLPCQVRVCMQHGDLHGENVLILPNGQPLLIDFASMTVGPSALDPVTLELSLLFHPAAALLRADWPTFAQAERWRDLDEYLVNCPAPAFVNACREWARDVTGSERGLLACVYAVAVWHLGHEGADNDLALALVRGVRRELVST